MLRTNRNGPLERRRSGKLASIQYMLERNTHWLGSPLTRIEGVGVPWTTHYEATACSVGDSADSGSLLPLLPLNTGSLKVGGPLASLLSVASAELSDTRPPPLLMAT